MQNLLSPRWMVIKAVLFLAIAGLAAFVVLLQNPTWTVAACLVLVGWSCSRAYYFAFYVVQHYVDPSFRFADLADFGRWWWGQRRKRFAPDGQRRCVEERHRVPSRGGPSATTRRAQPGQAPAS